MLRRIQYFLAQQIIANFYAFYAESKIKGLIAKVDLEHLSFTSDKPADLDTFNDELKTYEERQDERRKTIDDKAKSCLLIITVSTTVILAGLNLVKERKVSFGYLLLALVVLGITYFVASAITSVRALDFSPFYVSHPNEWFRDLRVGQSTRVAKPETTVPLYRRIILNDYVLNIRANFVSATLIGIRNGVILLSIASGMALLNLGNQITYLETDSNQRTTAPSNPKETQYKRHEVSNDHPTSTTSESKAEVEPKSRLPENPKKTVRKARIKASRKP